MISILQAIPQISLSNGYPSSLPPLVFMIFLSMCKDFYEDWKRHVSDDEENNLPVEVVHDGNIIIKKWKELNPGEIVILKDEERVPADILLLWSSDEKLKAFVETKSLDGETNLKQKLSIKNKFQDNILKAKSDELRMDSMRDIIKYYQGFDFSLKFEKENDDLNRFYGQIKIKDHEEENLSMNNLLLRGCTLRNTSRMLGIVTYTGHNTKIMMNSLGYRSKQSKVFKQLN